MEVNARAAYGGTVPASDEVTDLSTIQVVVATPEAVSGLLSADSTFFSRISLVICDEGHLLDGESRGIGLELLLSRLKAREIGAPRFVFISAIVPNIEEINHWLGGRHETVVTSDFRPALADFAVLRVQGSGASTVIALELHPEDAASRFSIDRFLNSDDFRFRNRQTNRFRTYKFETFKTQAVATARKSLRLGAVALFCANKRGNQGAEGIAEELLDQLSNQLPLPQPIEFVQDRQLLANAVEYLTGEYGSDWLGTRTLGAGAALHHGDIPQESREVIEGLVREGAIRLAICTSTLAEGVNLPIRTIVLYSVKRRDGDGAAKNLLSRDIKNLVGRAGRAGASTKGLVICANADQWELIEPVANQEPGEDVRGALYVLLTTLRERLALTGLSLTNSDMEATPFLHSVIDGIDSTLVDLAAEEIGEEELVEIATELSTRTFAAQQASAEPQYQRLIRDVFVLRARRIFGIQAKGRLSWVRETGARARLIDSVENSLQPMRDRWDDIASPIDPQFIKTLLTWVWLQPNATEDLAEVFEGNVPEPDTLFELVMGWVKGSPLVAIAAATRLPIGRMLFFHSRVLSFTVQVIVEQGLALLRKLVEAAGGEVSQAVVEFAEHLRFGVPNAASRHLASGGVRHRRAAVVLGQSPELQNASIGNSEHVLEVARQVILDENRWSPLFGRLVYANTVKDLARRTGTLPV